KPARRASWTCCRRGAPWSRPNVLAQVRGEIALGLIQVYRALGGGWQIRLEACGPDHGPPGTLPMPTEKGDKPDTLPESRDKGDGKDKANRMTALGVE